MPGPTQSSAEAETGFIDGKYAVQYAGNWAALAAIEWPDDELSVFATLKGSLFALDDELLCYCTTLTFGELRAACSGWELLHYDESPRRRDAQDQRIVVSMVARK